MSYANLIVNIEAPIAIIRINRPQKLNALNADTLNELDTVIAELAADRAVRAVIITGAGEKAFVAGADISQITDLSEQQGQQFARHGQQIFNRIQHLTKPVIAAVNGFALGGGCELALACHLRIASEKARFGLPEINLGILPGYGGTQRLPRLVGSARALQMMLTGDMIDARTALQTGLVNEVVAADALMETAVSMAKKLAEKAPVSVEYILSATYRGADIPLEDALEIEAELFGKICSTEDMKEGTLAFLEKRTPEFKGK